MVFAVLSYWGVGVRGAGMFLSCCRARSWRSTWVRSMYPGCHSTWWWSAPALSPTSTRCTPVSSMCSTFFSSRPWLSRRPSGTSKYCLIRFVSSYVIDVLYLRRKAILRLFFFFKHRLLNYTNLSTWLWRISLTIAVITPVLYKIPLTLLQALKSYPFFSNNC